MSLYERVKEAILSEHRSALGGAGRGAAGLAPRYGLAHSALLKRIAGELDYIPPLPGTFPAVLKTRCDALCAEVARQSAAATSARARVRELREFAEGLRAQLTAAPSVFDTRFSAAQLVDREVDLRIRLHAAGEILAEAEEKAPAPPDVNVSDAVAEVRREMVVNLTTWVRRLGDEWLRLKTAFDEMERAGRASDILTKVWERPQEWHDLDDVMRAYHEATENLRLVDAEDRAKNPPPPPVPKTFLETFAERNRGEAKTF